MALSVKEIEEFIAAQEAEKARRRMTALKHSAESAERMLDGDLIIPSVFEQLKKEGKVKLHIMSPSIDSSMSSEFRFTPEEICELLKPKYASKGLFLKFITVIERTFPQEWVFTISTSEND